MTEKKFYFYKLKNDFFKRHDIRIIEKMPNGERIVLFYTKMIAESVGHEGSLRFSKAIPYTAEMLATVLYTDQDIVDQGIQTLLELELLIIDGSGTYILTKIAESIKHDTEAAEKKRDYRKRKAADQETTEILTSEELSYLFRRYGKETGSDYLVKFKLHIASEGKTYKSNLATIEKWLNQDGIEAML